MEARRIWLNLELAKKPVQCLESILIHELTHQLDAPPQRALYRVNTCRNGERCMRN